MSALFLLRTVPFILCNTILSNNLLIDSRNFQSFPQHFWQPFFQQSRRFFQTRIAVCFDQPHIQFCVDHKVQSHQLEMLTATLVAEKLLFGCFDCEFAYVGESIEEILLTEFRHLQILYQRLYRYLVTLMQYSILFAVLLNSIICQMHISIMQNFLICSIFLASWKDTSILLWWWLLYTFWQPFIIYNCFCLVIFIFIIIIVAHFFCVSWDVFSPCNSGITIFVQIHFNSIFSTFPQQNPHSDIKLVPIVQQRIGYVLLNDITWRTLFIFCLIQFHTDLLTILTEDLLQLFQWIYHLDALTTIQRGRFDNPQLLSIMLI